MFSSQGVLVFLQAIVQRYSYYVTKIPRDKCTRYTFRIKMVEVFSRRKEKLKSLVYYGYLMRIIWTGIFMLMVFLPTILIQLQDVCHSPDPLQHLFFFHIKHV